MAREKPYAQVEYLNFEDWKEVKQPKRELLKIHSGHWGAPQVFYFRPQKRWYLICQACDDSWEPKDAAVYATSTNIADPALYQNSSIIGGYSRNQPEPSAAQRGRAIFTLNSAQNRASPGTRPAS